MKKVQLTLELTVEEARAVLNFLAGLDNAADREAAAAEREWLAETEDPWAATRADLHGACDPAECADARLLAEVKNDAFAAAENAAWETQTAKAAAADPVPLPDPFAAEPEWSNGLYRRDARTLIGTNRAAGYVYVYKASAGDHYLCKEVEIESDGTTATLGGYLGAAARFTSPRLRVAPREAAAFGQVFGWCGYCARTLTDPASQLVGCGKICADKNGIAHPGN